VSSSATAAFNAVRDSADTADAAASAAAAPACCAVALASTTADTRSCTICGVRRAGPVAMLVSASASACAEGRAADRSVAPRGDDEATHAERKADGDGTPRDARRGAAEQSEAAPLGTVRGWLLGTASGRLLGTGRHRLLRAGHHRLLGAGSEGEVRTGSDDRTDRGGSAATTGRCGTTTGRRGGSAADRRGGGLGGVRDPSGGRGVGDRGRVVVTGDVGGAAPVDASGGHGDGPRGGGGRRHVAESVGRRRWGRRVGPDDACLPAGRG